MQIRCPHCAESVMNDGSMAGQVVSCPHCRGTFQMPAIPDPTHRDETEEALLVEVSRLESLAQRYKFAHKVLTYVAGGAAFFMVLLFGVHGFLAVQVPPREKLLLFFLFAGGMCLFQLLHGHELKDYVDGRDPNDHCMYTGIGIGVMSCVASYWISDPSGVILLWACWSLVAAWAFLDFRILKLRAWVAQLQSDQYRRNQEILQEQAERGAEARLTEEQTCPSCREPGCRELVKFKVIDTTIGQRLHTWTDWDGRHNSPHVRRQQMVSVELRKYRVRFQCRSCGHTWSAKTEFKDREPTNEDFF